MSVLKRYPTNIWKHKSGKYLKHCGTGRTGEVKMDLVDGREEAYLSPNLSFLGSSLPRFTDRGDYQAIGMIVTIEPVNEFEGMSNTESIDHQVEQWALGNPLHNTVCDECCPDFSCCSDAMASESFRQAFLKAYREGGSDTISTMLMAGLGGLFEAEGVDVHIAGEIDESFNEH